MDINNSSGFKFNEKLDIAFLNDLFEGDTEYATVIFGNFIKDLPQYWAEIEDAYQAHKISELRSAVHKTKTLFGYVGHTKTLEAFQDFENHTSEVQDTNELAKEFNHLIELKENALRLIEQEYQRLLKFHQ